MFQQVFRDKPYQRLSATIVANPFEPFHLKTDEEEPVCSQLVLLSPGSRRQQLSITGGDGFIFDIDITSPAYARLKHLLPVTGSRVLSQEMTAPILKQLQQWHKKELLPKEAFDLFHSVIEMLAPTEVRIKRDARLEKILNIIDQNMRDELTVAGLAKSVGLSESRLRSIAQKQLGCSLARYLRWATAWKTADLWRPGMTYTEVAHAAGFHDLSHANRTFTELFGMAPSRVLKSDAIRLHRCTPPD